MSGVWNPTSPEHDRTEPLEPPTPARTYIVCSTPRSGSGLLCRGLVAAGSGGVPAEYFNPRQRGPLTARWGCDGSVASYAAALRRHRTDAQGTFGLKLHWNQVSGLGGDGDGDGDQNVAAAPPGVLAELFPGAAYVHIVRLDLTAQAVSLWRAKESGVWAERQGAPRGEAPPTRYSYRGILDCVHEIAVQEAEWLRFFRRSGIDPIMVTYEDLVSDHGAECARVLAAIGAPVLDRSTAPDSRRQADRASTDLAQRFEADARAARDPGLLARAAGRVRRRLR